MPTPQAEAELLEAGYTKDKPGTCRKCQRAVDLWKSPSGNAVDFNPMNHPTAPGVLHFLSCGEESDLKKLQGET